MEKIIELKDVVKIYKDRNTFFSNKVRENFAVDKLSLNLYKGEVLGLIGESGCGKSTLARIISNLEKPDSGKILYKNKDIGSLKGKDYKTYRKNLQMIFQNPFDSFNPKERIITGMMRIVKLYKISQGIERIEKTMEEYGLLPYEDYLNRYPRELSGGQLQRLAIVRTSILKPEIMVVDEPVSMLDLSVKAEIINLFNSFKSKGGSMILISHDVSNTSYIADRIAVMYLGRIVETGTTKELIENPLHPYTNILIELSRLDSNIQMDKISGESKLKNSKGCFFANRCYKAQAKCFIEYPKVESIGNRSFNCFYPENI